MSDSNRSKFDYVGLVAAVTLSAVLGFWLWASTTNSQSRIEHEAAKNAKEHAHTAYVEIRAACSGLPVAESDVCANQINYAAGERRRDEYDLEAQRTMAVWTRAMGIAAMIGMSVGIVGVGLVYFTFQETKRAASEARRNVDAFIASERGWLSLEFFARGKHSPEDHIIFRAQGILRVGQEYKSPNCDG